MRNDPIVARRDQSFVWVIFDPKNPFFAGLSKPSVSRLMYLATFIGKDGVIENTNSYRTGRPLTQKEIAKHLRCEERTFWRFIRETKDAGILTSANGTYCLNPKFFRKGVIKRGEVSDLLEKEAVLVRLYIGAMRSLYELAVPDSVCCLSYLFRMMPFVNCEHNIVCTNPSEEDVAFVQPMLMGDFANSVGYGLRNVARLRRTLGSLKFMTADGPVPAIQSVAVTAEKPEQTFWRIDPRLYYGGSKLLARDKVLWPDEKIIITKD